MIQQESSNSTLYFSSVKSSTGIPEGDPISVAVMTAYSYVWAQFTSTPKVQTYCFADNLEWLSVYPETHEQTYNKNNFFQKSFRQEISMRKSWAWATNKEH